MSSPYTATREEIELVCAYIADDQTVANYFGISRQRVEHIRATTRESVERHIPKSNPEGSHPSSGEMSMRVFEVDAIGGSRELRERLGRLFRKWEREHGFQAGAGQILLPAGYRPERERAAA